MTRDVFSRYHPLVNLCYFVMVLLCTMCFWHPVILLISFGAAVAYAIQLNDVKKMKQQVLLLLPVILMAAVLNPMFNHKGATVLTYLPSGNPLTLESLLYGLAAAVMLAAVILWFSCYTVVMTSDKFIYLF
ncbi:MAG: energy-coupling factor transporter transmembrane protein EcfT, partial [Peptococcaceae bacterium]|nr:energy-coupling factor transporter transmembrane protein EcfT [Peptococcaceae bacterium]